MVQHGPSIIAGAILGQSTAAPPASAAAAASQQVTGGITRADEIREDLSKLSTETIDVAAVVGRLLMDWGVRILGVVLILAGAWIVAGWARRSLYRAINRPEFDQTLVRFVSNLARWAVLVVGLVAALTIFGIAPASLAAIMGAAGLAVGLALQGSLSNLAAGIMLLILRPFNVGDSIVVAGQTGRVDDIELFTTKLDTADNRRIIVPNGQIFGAVIENLTHHGRRCINVAVGVSYDADVDRTREVLLAAARSARGRLDDPPPNVIVQNFGPSSVDWQVQVWTPTAEFGNVRQDLIRAIKRELHQAGIAIPYPQMEVWQRTASQPGDGLSPRSSPSPEPRAG